MQILPNDICISKNSLHPKVFAFACIPQKPNQTGPISRVEYAGSKEEMWVWNRLLFHQVKGKSVMLSTIPPAIFLDNFEGMKSQGFKNKGSSVDCVK